MKDSSKQPPKTLFPLPLDEAAVHHTKTITHQISKKLKDLETLELELQNLSSEIFKEECEENKAVYILDSVKEKITHTRDIQLKLQEATTQIQKNFIHALGSNTLSPEESLHIKSELKELDQIHILLDEHVEKINDISKLIHFIEHEKKLSSISLKIDLEENPQECLAELHKLKVEIKDEEKWEHLDENDTFLKNISKQMNRTEDHIKKESLENLLLETRTVYKNTLAGDISHSEKSVILKSLIKGLNLIEEFGVDRENFPLRNFPLYEKMMKEARELSIEIVEAQKKLIQDTPEDKVLLELKEEMDQIEKNILSSKETIQKSSDILSFIQTKYLLFHMEDSMEEIIQTIFQLPPPKEYTQLTHSQVALGRAQHLLSLLLTQIEETQKAFTQHIQKNYRNKHESASLFQILAKLFKESPEKYQALSCKQIKENLQDNTYLSALKEFSKNEKQQCSKSLLQHCLSLEKGLISEGILEVLAVSDALEHPFFVFQNSLENPLFWELFLSKNDHPSFMKVKCPIFLLYNTNEQFQVLYPINNE